MLGGTIFLNFCDIIFHFMKNTVYTRKTFIANMENKCMFELDRLEMWGRDR